MSIHEKEAGLYLIPITISEDTQDNYIPAYTRELIKSIDHFAVENIRTARRFISSLKLEIKIEDLKFFVLDKNSGHHDIETIVSQIKAGQSFGVMSESGSPGVADPGSLLVAAAHRNGIKVHPIPGASSILLALMGSGFSGQNFRFVGYLPVEKRDLKNSIKDLERRSSSEDETQIFIETPYRNHRLLQSAVSTLNGNTHLCVASDLTGKNEFIQTKQVKEWKHSMPEIGKRPTVFLIYSGNVP